MARRDLHDFLPAVDDHEILFSAKWSLDATACAVGVYSVLTGKIEVSDALNLEHGGSNECECPGPVERAGPDSGTNAQLTRRSSEALSLQCPPVRPAEYGIRTCCGLVIAVAIVVASVSLRLENRGGNSIGPFFDESNLFPMVDNHDGAQWDISTYPLAPAA